MPKTKISIFHPLVLPICKTDKLDQRRYLIRTRFIVNHRESKRKLYGHESTWLGRKTKGLAHWFPLRKPSLRRSSSVNHLTESSPRSTTRPSSSVLRPFSTEIPWFFVTKCQSGFTPNRKQSAVDLARGNR